MSFQKYNRTTAISVVIANMIGTGVFTSLGFQIPAMSDNFAIVALWLVGGLIALCGALTYTEVATRLKDSGGEYLFLSKMYHPAIGFSSAFVSLFAGFAIPVAANALILGKYASPLFHFDESSFIAIGNYHLEYYKFISLIVIAVVAFIHIGGVHVGGMAQTIFTGLKMALIVFFCLAPLFVTSTHPGTTHFSPTSDSFPQMFSLAFAGSLYFVMYAYSGWNAAAYITGNIENPRKNLPISLIYGTIVVTVLYVLLNVMFLYAVDREHLGGQLDIGNVVALELFGSQWGVLFSALFSIALISTISAMTITGPRVSEQVGKDYKVFSMLSRNSKGGTPINGILIQSFISVLVVLAFDAEVLLKYIGLTLTIYGGLTVFGVFVLRKRNKDSDYYKLPLYPLPPLIFLAGCLWMIYFGVAMDVYSLIASLTTMAAGIGLYFVAKQINK